MTLLSMVQAAAAEIPVAQPATVISNTDTTAMAFLGAAQAEGQALARKPAQGWIAQETEYTFLTSSFSLTGTIANSGAGGVAVITALSSTSSITALIFGATGTGLPLNTVIASVDSATQVTLNQAATTTGSGVSVMFAKFAFAVPADFNRPIDNTLWDGTRYWKMRGPLSPQQWQYYKRSIVTQANIQRLVRFVYIGGSQYLSIQPLPTDNGSTLVYEYVSKNWCKSSGGTGQSLWAADTDLGIIDEFLMQKGIVWRIKRMMGMAYDEEFAEYTQLVDKALAQDGGAETLTMAPDYGSTLLGGPLTNVRDGNFG